MESNIQSEKEVCIGILQCFKNLKKIDVKASWSK